MDMDILEDLRIKLIRSFDLEGGLIFIEAYEGILVINWSPQNDEHIDYDNEVTPMVEFSKKYLKKHNQTGFFYDAVYSHEI